MQNNIGIKCPFCQERTVYANVLTTVSFLSTQYITEEGISTDETTSLGELSSEASVRTTKFICKSCNKTMMCSEYSLKKDEDGIFSIVKKGGTK